MAIISMTFNVEMTLDEWLSHPLRELGIYNYLDTYPMFLKTEYNINTIDWNYNYKIHQYVIEFESAQDYILWQLHQ